MSSLSLVSLFAFFSEEQKSIKKGENHFHSQHVEGFGYSRGVLRGEVHASMKNKVYKVTIHLNETNDIQSTECECPRGAFKCSHAAALFIHGIHNLSRTDVECQWRKKKTTKLSQQSSEEMFPPPKKYCPLSRKPTAEDREALYTDLCEYGRFTGLWWLMSPEPKPVTLPIPTIEEIIYSDELLQAEGLEAQLRCLIAKASIDSITVIENISKLTIGQRDNPSWHLVRKGRLTASNFGVVLKAKRVTPSLLKRLMGEYDLSRVKAVNWGVTNEQEGVKTFERLTSMTPKDTGIWLDTTGVIGASPDGLVGDNAVLEIKCPYTERNLTIDEATSTSKQFCLEKLADGSVRLREDHVYWHQVQGQMYLTNRKLCYFVVWTTKDAAVVKIARDGTWEGNLDMLKDFYFHHLFPKIVLGEL